MIVDGRYRVLETMLESDTRSVYLTEHQLIGRRMVVKLLHPSGASQHHVLSRFVNEAEIAGRLRHPNIVESTDMGVADGRPYVVFEHLEGTTLSEELARIKRMPLRRAVHIARQIALALGVAHVDGVLHGNLDASQVFLVDKDDDPDFVKVLGLGKLDSQLMPECPAPEQILGTALDHRCDVWAIGVLLYQMLEGRSPFPSEAGSVVARRRAVSQPPPAIQRDDVPKELADIVFTCLAKTPIERFADTADLFDALAPFDVRFARGSSMQNLPRTSSLYTPVPGTVRTYPTLPRRTITKRHLAIAGAAAVCGIGGLVFALGSSSAPASLGATVSPDPAPTPAPAAAPRVVGQEPTVALAIETTTPNARVVFRRHISAAPMTLAVPASHVPELVEVSAPGHQTMRYWMTVDQALHLQPVLVRGTGIADATELQTKIALGLVAPSEVKAAPKPVAKRAARAAPVESVAAPSSVTQRLLVTPDGAYGVASTVGQVPTIATAPVAPRNITGSELEANRIGGMGQVEPDNATRQAMRHSGSNRIVGRFELCVSATGGVTRVATSKSTGFAEFDRKVEGVLRTWRFSGGEAVCGPVSIAYSQQ
jgi:tRNA A-37 threonylcarbamoyl transferase component Bud32